MFSSLLNNMAFLLTEAQVIYPEVAEDGSLTYTSSPSGWPQALPLALCVLLGIVCVALTVVILLQKKRASGIGAAIAGSGETYWSRNKGKSLEGTLEKYTKWGGFAFIIVALLINMFM